MEDSEQYFVIEYFKNYLKYQYECFSTDPLQDFKEASAKRNLSDKDDLEGENTSLTVKTRLRSGQTSTNERNLTPETSPAESMVNPSFHFKCMTDNEKREKLRLLSSVIVIEDIDLLTSEAICDCSFLKNILHYMKPDEFRIPDGGVNENEYVPILYGLQKFLRARNFDSVSYLKSLKTRFNIQMITSDEKWELVKLTILVSFLCKDSEESLISRGLDFSHEKTSEVKPSFLKGLFQVLDSVLFKLNHFDDESVFGVLDCNKSTSFIKSNAEILNFRNSVGFNPRQETDNMLIDSLLSDEEDDLFDRACDNEYYNHLRDDEKMLSMNQSPLKDSSDNFLQPFTTFRTIDHRSSMVPYKNFNLHGGNQRQRVTINGILQRKFNCNDNSSLMYPNQSSLKRSSVSYLQQFEKEFETKESHLLNQISELKQRLTKFSEENSTLKDLLKEEEKENSRLTRDLKRIQKVEERFEHLKYCFEKKHNECEELTQNLQASAEQLSLSEKNTSKLLKTIKSQENIHFQHLKMFKESEDLLRSYYDKSLQTCLDQIKLRDEQQIPLQQRDREFRDLKHELEKTKRMEQSYFDLYTETLETLEEMSKRCEALEQNTECTPTNSQNELKIWDTKINRNEITISCALLLLCMLANLVL
ncbi:unnamed protein product [Moneuplotes crassus]|uniref:Uncharacterized protein n=2 Tax=Euplotes crassus TaxID=5936 RepID=A0AAD2D8T1_EUPCR|nr:unnamed protein product [Moneuplotes crassus]